MSSSCPNTTADQSESFHRFFECWLVEQNHHLQELISVSRDTNNNHITRDSPAAAAATTPPEATREEEETILRPLINRVILHYEEYYRTKSRWVKQDVLAMLTPSWRSTLEDAFLWIGGWRPSMAFHLLYSKTGLQVEAGLPDLIRGLSTGDLADLSSGQLSQVDELQRRSIREERGMTEEMATHQETVADSSMVELSHEVTELMENGEASHGMGGGVEEDRVESTLEPKEEGLETILERADELRLRTLKAVMEILSPIQSVHFLIAAAELHLRLHDWGKRRDTREQHVGGAAN